MRRSEIGRAQWPHVFWEADEIMVAKSKSDAGEGRRVPMVGPLKIDVRTCGGPRAASRGRVRLAPRATSARACHLPRARPSRAAQRANGSLSSNPVARRGDRARDLGEIDEGDQDAGALAGHARERRRTPRRFGALSIAAISGASRSSSDASARARRPPPRPARPRCRARRRRSPRARAAGARGRRSAGGRRASAP